jgi:Gas vesicle synthesis protein GvpL/GvpF
VIAAPGTTAWYVYGVVDAAATIAPGRLRLVEEGPLAAVVSAVPLSEFGEEPLAERLNDRMWLEAHVREHEDVLRRVATDSTVVPFRFGVIYRDLADVAAMLRERQPELTSALERVRGRIEVGVKAWADGARAEASPAGQTPKGASGRAYLERRLGEQQRTKERGAQLGEIARAVHERLLRHADDGVVNRPQPRELTGRDEPMILNGAYLVAGDGAALAAEVAALQAEYGTHGVAFEVTGPWPPHNFVEPESVEPGEQA